MIEIEVEVDGWLDALPKVQALVEVAAEAALNAVETPDGADLVVLLTDDGEMRELNKEYRHKDKATNVLSFPAQKMMHPHLGDIALGLETCVREAKEQSKPLANHIQHLVVHGVLHLLGYDHMEDRDAEEMEALETEILAGLGIPDPYSQDA